MAEPSTKHTEPADHGTARNLPSHVPTNLTFDLSAYLAPNSRIDPFSLAAGIHDELPPVFFSRARNPGLYDGTWVVTHYADIREVYQNADLYSTEGAANFQSLVGETFRMIPLAVDPPEHGYYRLLLNLFFSPKAIGAMEPAIRATINELIDGFAGAGACDLAYDFGRIYPVRVFMKLMGFPPEKFEDFLAWEYAILHSQGDVDKMKWGIGSAIAYLRSFVAEMKANPTSNLTSHIVHGEVHGRPITDEEIIGTVTFLWLGGLDTVAATTSLMFRRLALDPELQQRLRKAPDLTPNAIEEFLRVQPLVNSTRLVKQDHEIRGVAIKRGDHIMCFNLAGNFDPAEFEDPRDIRFNRPSNRHFTLAGGAHRCLGSHLARRELRLAVGEFLRRVPPFRMKPGADLTAYPGLIAAPRLPIVWDSHGVA